MKKIIVLIILLIGLSVQAVVIKGGVHYTVESAREEAFSKVRYTIPMDEHKKYLTDPGFSLDKNGKSKIRNFGRKVTFFSDGSYAVYYVRRRVAYFYNSDGSLDEISYNSTKKYPKIATKYDKNGKLTAVIYCVSGSESYIYQPDKKFVGHWIGDKFYEPDGEVSLIRKD